MNSAGMVRSAPPGTRISARVAGIMPDFAADTSPDRYRETIEPSSPAITAFSRRCSTSLQNQVPKPADMKQESYDRTLKARAFDVARYLLPLATNTSLGQIVNARTLETQVSRLLSHPVAEIRQLGVRLQAAATGAAWNVSRRGPRHAPERHRSARSGARRTRRRSAHARSEDRSDPGEVCRSQRLSDPDPRATCTRRRPNCCAASPLSRAARGPDRRLPTPSRSTSRPRCSTASATTPTGRFAAHVAALSEARRNEIIDLGLRHRGRHDELLREFSAGQALRFDILMDIGGFRDMHRHRRCVQILQSFTTAHGYAIPEGVPEAGVQPLYEATMQAAHTAYRRAGRRLGAGGRRIARSTSCPWPRRIARSSKWTSPKPSTSPSCVRAPGTFLLSPRRLGDVPRRRAQASGPGEIFPRHGCRRADRSAEAIGIRPS